MNRAAPAALPPSGLPGLDARFSRLVEVRSAGATRTWHVLDNAARLAELRIAPTGTLLCVHGNPTWSYLWRRLLSAATAQAAAGGTAWRVVAPDQLEMGFSERTGERRTLPRRVRDLGELTAELGIDGPVVTVGHDWGGVVALGWAVDHADQLSGIVSLNTAVHQAPETPVPAPLRLALLPPVLGASTAGTPAFLEATLALGHPPLPGPVKDAFRAPYRGADRRQGIRDFVADIPAEPGHPSRPELDRIAEGIRHLDVPALLLWGARDPVFQDRYLDDLFARLRHPSVHRFPDAGHLIAEDVDYASAALAWLDDPAPEATPAAEPPPGIGGAPLWSVLDELRDSPDTALVELAPPAGGAARVVSWRLLSRRVRELAAGLTAAGVRPGHRVSLLVPPGADLTAALYACLRIGAIVVVADAGLGLRGLSRAVTGARPDHVIGALPGLAAARALRWPGQRIAIARYPAPVRRLLGISASFGELAARGRGAALPPEPAPADTAAVLFTSGSTGPAKGVVYTHVELQALRDALARQYGVGIGTGLVAGFAPFALLGPALGARSATPDMDVTSPATLTASAVADAVAAVDATVVFLSPAAVANVVATAGSLTPDRRRALTGVRTVLSAGAPVARELLEGVAALMPSATASTPYGMTEGLLLTSATLDDVREAAVEADGGAGVLVGPPVDGVEVRIAALDRSGAATGEPAVVPGVAGEIVVSADHLRDGYDRLELTQREAAHGPAMESGGRRWHRTGDVGHLDEAGRLWVEGRLVHVVVTAEGVITPVGPEQRIGELPEVARAGLAGVGPRGTQQAVAVVELRNPVRRPRLADAELAERVRSAAGVPLAAVLVVPRLPTDIRHNSKVDRTRLSRWAARVLRGERMTRP
ncbi:alpha/beta fold hydrolase [Naasia aerilata]|uniref:Acyl-CoA synthetase n=1 Tax=Naasia aerilata TaxID=1162966 RepID=A0ABN6XR27_9MICO|nr:alpha/beta fold hydrolase [Naasia aerilata]BDZ47426.1 acyl-CoA synthetase [Naasia aerilata]